jgi:hypothetical protein
MKTLRTMYRVALMGLMLAITLPTIAQQPDLQFFRDRDANGINVFEAPFTTNIPYEGLKVRVGGNFAQQVQMLQHSNTADFRPFAADTTRNQNGLYPLAPGFNLATANLNIDVQLEDGIRLSLESYMSSRHHPEFWVKGGYIQVDRLPMFGNPEWFDKYVTVKMGHMEVNYGDQHFRRSDNGNAIHNPFVGNYIMDAFATEIGGEVYIHPNDQFFLMLGMTHGLINGNIQTPPEGITRGPSILAKAGYDNQVNDDLRVRLSASLYNNSGTIRNTLYAGDRTGSRYYLVMEPEFYGGAMTAATATNRFTSGRLSPDFTGQVMSVMINPFVKFKGLEFFGTYEMASGKTNNEDDVRSVSQIAAEVIYRFLEDEQLFVGARYNQVSGALPGATLSDISVDRMQIGLGWFVTPNIMMKGEYVVQNYNDFPAADIRNGGKFSGMMIEAVVGF